MLITFIVNFYVCSPINFLRFGLFIIRFFVYVLIAELASLRKCEVFFVIFFFLVYHIYIHWQSFLQLLEQGMFITDNTMAEVLLSCLTACIQTCRHSRCVIFGDQSCSYKTCCCVEPGRTSDPLSWRAGDEPGRSFWFFTSEHNPCRINVCKDQWHLQFGP